MGKEPQKNLLKYQISEKDTLYLNTNNGAIDLVPKGLELPKDRQIHYDYQTLEKKFNEHQKNVPYWFYNLTTLRCNFACPICYEKGTELAPDTSIDTLNNNFQKIKEIQEQKNVVDQRVNIIVFGGEPLCADPSVIEHILETSRTNRWHDVFVTNGSRIDKFLPLLNKYHDIISDFRISLDGKPDIHDKRRPFKNGQGSFETIVKNINLLLQNELPVKMQTILGAGNIDHLKDIINIVEKNGWFDSKFFQWRIEGSHDYANLDPQKDEISEGVMVNKLIDLYREYPQIQTKLKFESFKYLSHITQSFKWLGDYKTYWGPKLGFCEPQKGFQYVFSTDGSIYNCPRTINNPDYNLATFKRTLFSEKENCVRCDINTLCGGGCVVQKKYYPDFDCRQNATGIISEFIDLTKEKILEKSKPNQVVSINKLW